MSLSFADEHRAVRWQAAMKEPDADLWLHGYWKFDWRDTYVRVAAIDKAPEGYSIQIDPSTPPQYPAVPGARFYAVNALALLDAPGEYFVTPKGQLYFMPPGGTIQDAVVSVLHSVIDMADASHVSFKNLAVSASQGPLMQISAAQAVSVEDCLITNAGGCCLSLAGSDTAVRNSTVFGCGGAGISLSGGDIKTLEPGNVSAVANLVTNFSRIKRTYNPGI